MPSVASLSETSLTKFVRLGDRITVGDHHRNLIAQMEGDSRFSKPDADFPELRKELLKKYGEVDGVDMGELVRQGKRVEIGGESQEYDFPPEAPEQREPIRDRTQRAMSENFPDGVFFYRKR